MKNPEEWFEVVDEQGRALRLATRRECHSNRVLRHRVAHVLVWDALGRLYLQKRSAAKDIQPGKWDTSVGGHLLPGEAPEAGACRELGEELGIAAAEPLAWLYQYEMQSPVETELVDTFSLVWEGEVFPDPGEIEEGRWWTLDEIRCGLGQGIFTPNFEEEFQRWHEKISN
ncbi:MAG: NUDIX domain-containing protein [Candidatus Firestonebacteria bacterium]|nr:NUDIX domain-containing protein [Candidatus Firestonebacteria bacterium]